MPTYQYACTSCGEQVEAVQRFSDDPLTVCPACGGTLRKVFSPVGIVFKGSGFYRTDSRQATAANGAAKDAPAKDAPKDGKKEASGPAASQDGSSGSGSSGSSGSDAKKPAGPKSSQPAGASTN